MTKLRYQDAGVNITAGNQLVELIKPLARKTHNAQVLNPIGGFAGFYSLAKNNYQEPVLVSATDGVGTKLRLALEWEQHDSIGIDLVAMCVNDIICSGAEPLFFLDYFATGELDVALAETVIACISKGCQQAQCALIGGETAEMPGCYQGRDYDLAGFCVGIVEQQQVIDGSKIQAGDVIIGLTSSGAHANGFSLIRKILHDKKIGPNIKLEQRTLGEQLLTPTEIYVNTIQHLKTKYTLHGIAHITGGGFIENIPRILPDGLTAKIDKNSWSWPSLFSFLQDAGNIEESEMLRTFNCGIGMIVCVAANDAEPCLHDLSKLGVGAYAIGKIEPSQNEKQPIILC